MSRNDNQYICIEQRFMFEVFTIPKINNIRRILHLNCMSMKYINGDFKSQNYYSLSTHSSNLSFFIFACHNTPSSIII